MRLLLRSSIALACLCSGFFAGCDDASKSESTGFPAASARPDVELVVRTVQLKKSMTTPPSSGGGDDESWTAVDGKIYAIVTADMGHNKCKAGDRIETSKAKLNIDGADVNPVGGGARGDKLCVQCQPTEVLDCNTATRLRPFTFIFEVPEKSDVTKSTLKYKGREAPLAKAKVSDSRGNDALSKQIAVKKIELTDLKKKLENTSNMANGKVIQSEMARVKKEIDLLESKKK